LKTGCGDIYAQEETTGVWGKLHERRSYSNIGSLLYMNITIMINSRMMR
jgi:hypothetical protein